MDRRFLPRPIRRWLRKRYQQAEQRPIAGQVPVTQGSGGGGGGGASGGGAGAGRGMRLHIPLPILLAFLVFGTAISGASVYQAMQAGMSRVQIASPGQIGSLHVAFLVGGQFFIGTLESTDRGSVVLNDVFYVQSSGNQLPVLPSAAQAAPSRGAQLVRRQDGDWHQPDRMAIPIDRILLLESVGRDSLVAKLVAEARARQAGATPK